MNMNMNVVSQEFVQKICEDMKEHYPFLEIKPVEENIERIIKKEISRTNVFLF